MYLYKDRLKLHLLINMFEQKFIARELRDFLNEKYGQKKTGTKFNDQDIEAYLRRGSLPKYLGGFKLKEVKSGIRSVRQYKIVDLVIESKIKKDDNN